MTKYIFIGILMVTSQLFAQSIDRYAKDLNILQSEAAYLGSVDYSHNNELVDLEQVIPGVFLDIRYATTNNFTGQQIYTAPRAFARTMVADALVRVQQQLNADGLGLVIYDAYRPYAATVRFYEVYHDTTFVASPYTGSRHNRGAAVDVGLIDINTREIVQMPTVFDSFSDTAAPDFQDLPAILVSNREKLITVMKENGFTVYSSEWWHFDYVGWKEYELMDLSFDMLEHANTLLNKNNDTLR